MKKYTENLSHETPITQTDEPTKNRMVFGVRKFTVVPFYKILRSTQGWA